VKTHHLGMDDEPTLGWLIGSIGRGIVQGLKRNKLAAVLAGMTGASLITLSLGGRFEGLPHYRESILPRLLRLESGFINRLKAAENASGEWRAYYFQNAHRQVRDILRAARLDRPQGYVARRKHRTFIRYYELLDSKFNSIELQLRVDPNLDYLQELTHSMDELKPIRDAWAAWALSAQEAG
jgi:hypothetical protein